MNYLLIFWSHRLCYLIQVQEREVKVNSGISQTFDSDPDSTFQFDLDPNPESDPIFTMTKL